jgi:hypothetical protein
MRSAGFLVATLALAACSRAEVAPAGTTEAAPVPAPASVAAGPSTTLELLVTADDWGEYAPCG